MGVTLYHLPHVCTDLLFFISLTHCCKIPLKQKNAWSLWGLSLMFKACECKRVQLCSKKRQLREAAALPGGGSKSNSSVPHFREGFDVTGISCSSLKEHQRYLPPPNPSKINHDIHSSVGHLIGNTVGFDIFSVINASLTALNVINYPKVHSVTGWWQFLDL